MHFQSINIMKNLNHEFYMDMNLLNIWYRLGSINFERKDQDIFSVKAMGFCFITWSARGIKWMIKKVLCRFSGHIKQIGSIQWFWKTSPLESHSCISLFNNKTYINTKIIILKKKHVICKTTPINNRFILRESEHTRFGVSWLRFGRYATNFYGAESETEQPVHSFSILIKTRR